MSKRDPFVFIGLAVVTVAAAVGSFGALRGTALLAGWTSGMSSLLPVTVDATAAVATRIWLSEGTHEKARHFARSVALGAVFVSLLGNGVYHLAEAGYLRPGVWLVIAAGGISPLALAVVAHLAVLRGAADESEVPAPEVEPHLPVHVEPVLPVPEIAPTPQVPRALPRTPKPALPATRTAAARVDVPLSPAPTQSPTRSTSDGRSWDDLLTAARDVDAATRKATGRAAGVGKLKSELGVGQARAQQLRDALAAVPVPA